MVGFQASAGELVTISQDNPSPKGPPPTHFAPCLLGKTPTLAKSVAQPVPQLTCAAEWG